MAEEDEIAAGGGIATAKREVDEALQSDAGFRKAADEVLTPEEQARQHIDQLLANDASFRNAASQITFAGDPGSIAQAEDQQREATQNLDKAGLKQIEQESGVSVER